MPNAVLHPESNDWVRGLAKVGYAVKGFLYALIGVLALQVAFGQGGQLAGEHEAVRHVQKQPFGNVLLVIIGVGFLGYALWRVLEGALDLSRVGKDAKGIFHRIGSLAAGLVNGTLGVATLRLALGDPAQDDKKSWVARLMNDDGGKVALMAIGVAIVVAGVVQVHKGYTRKFLEELRISEAKPNTQRWIVRLGRVGHIARGVVFTIIGVGLVHAVASTNPGEAKGFGEALAQIASQPFGMILLTLVALGLLGYGTFLIMTTKYRRLGSAEPRHAYR